MEGGGGDGGATRREHDVAGYLPALDGLRAISIVSVVGYHVGLPGFGNGFVGVDVFFVISGFLIINQIVAQLASGSFSFAEFWARRVLRILPPYLLVVAACLLVVPLVMVTPTEYRQSGREATASALMAANFLFLNEQGYFDRAAELKPLLNMWSLAVEEQFYLLAPLVLFALWRLGTWLGRWSRAFWTAAVVTVFAASLVACIAATSADTNQAFYLMPFRAWEFVIGGAVPTFVAAARRQPRWAADAMALAGLGMILVAVYGFGPDITYPSYYALLPGVGAGLVILMLVARPTNPVTRLLALRPMIGLGLVSYAWYLWHWPLLALVRTYNFGDRILAIDVLVGLLSLAIAGASYLLVERPIKRWRHQRRTSRQGWRVVFAGVAACVLVAASGRLYSEVAAPALERGILDGWWEQNDRSTASYDECALDDPHRLRPTCLKTIARDPVGILLGNSHAHMLYEAVHRQAEANETALITIWRAACPPLYPIPALESPARRACHAWLTASLRTIETTLGDKVSFAIVSSRWNERAAPDAKLNARLGDVLASEGIGAVVPAETRPVLGTGLAATIARLKAIGTERILLVGPVPEFPYFAADCLLRADRRGIERDKCTTARTEVEERRRTTVLTLRFIAAQYANVRLIDPIDVFCGTSSCVPYDEGGLLYTDDQHLSDHGAEKLYAAFRPDFEWAFAGG